MHGRLCGKWTEGRWSGVKSTDSNPLRVQVHDARKRSARSTWLFLRSIWKRRCSVYSARSANRPRKTRKPRKRPTAPTTVRRTERREFRQSLTLTIFDALVLLIVATGGVADGRARFATFVVGAAILDGGTALLAAIGPPWIQTGDRGADREHRHGQQSDRRDHLGAVATFDQRRCWNATFCIAVIPVLEKKAHALAIQRRTKRYRCVDQAKETAAKLWPREVTRYERNERNAET